MAERRGHRKLRLCSNKYYERKKYFPKKLLVSIPRMSVTILSVSIPLKFLSFKVSLPLSAYTQLPPPSLETMWSCIQQLGILSEGTMKLVAFNLTLHFACLGWNHDMQAGMLHIYQLATNEIGLVIGVSLSIKEDFSWILSCRSQPVSPEHCSLLEDTPSLLNSGLWILLWYIATLPES